MFTGIIETMGIIASVSTDRGNRHFVIESDLAGELRVDQSVAHNGVCLTVTSVNDSTYTVTAIEETLQCSNLGLVRVGDRVNLERSMPMNGRLDGHIVQGHVDTTAVCDSIEEREGSRYFTFRYKSDQAGHLTVQKGSVSVNGVSLTVVRSEPGLFSVAVIPYTFEHTNFKDLRQGDQVNVEFDILGKYVAVYMQQMSLG